MEPSDLARYLHEHIPLSAAMQVRVVCSGTDEVVLAAPLAPNINHRSTVFGGSAAALALLAGWSLLHVRLAPRVPAARLVVQKSSIDYLRPMRGEFLARAYLEDAGRWAPFLTQLARRGRARLAVSAVLESGGELAGRCSGEFVALHPPEDPP